MKVSSSMTTDEALKAFVSACDNPRATGKEIQDASAILAASIRDELQNDPEFRTDPLSEKISALIRYILRDCAEKCVAFTRLEKYETTKREKMLEAIQDALIALFVAVNIEESISQNEK